ncbi:MAG: hypothetical protein LBR33_00335 [Propionibacteriaceae bacterium]|jgi:hypothetical protein|nr:hypothetical protein [Propionibacteriaceae bacterium]
MAQFLVTAFGAAGDGVTLDTAPIQASLDAAAAAGGGTVVVPPGRFLAGSLHLGSGVELRLEAGAVLQCSGHWADITDRRVTSALSGGIVTPGQPPQGVFLAATGAVDVAVTGAGTIDGGGRFYVAEDRGDIYRMPAERPFTLFFEGCRNVRLAGVTLTDGALWTVRLTGCADVVAEGLSIRGHPLVPNADGIDLDRCRRVVVRDCAIRTPDDAISLKATAEYDRYGACEDILVERCRLESKSAAVAFGADAAGPIRRVTLRDLVIRRSNRGVSLKCCQAGDFEDIDAADLDIETETFPEPWWGRGEPLQIGVFPWQDETGAVRRVTFRRVRARAENGVNVAAWRPGLVEDVLFEDVAVTLGKWTAEPGGLFDRRPYPGGEELFPHAIAGFYIDQAADVTLRRCSAQWEDPRPPYAATDLVLSSTACHPGESRDLSSGG